MKKISNSTLHKYNIVAGFLHLAQAGAVLALSREFSLPVSGSFLEFNRATESLEPANTVLFDLSLPMLIAAFFFLSAIAHFTIATVYRKRYEKDLSRGLNVARWIEYSISASIMMVAISLLVGIYDFVSLVMIFGLTSVMNLTGWIMEVHNQTTKKTNWLSFWVGSLAGLIPWLAVAFYLWLTADNGGETPTFVYWIFVSIFLFFNCFALNMVLQYRKIGRWKDYKFGEFAYIVLSLVAKSLLAWQVFAGTLQP
jgi:hypothetical protein